MQRNLLSFALLTAAVITVNSAAIVYAETQGGTQQLRYEIVETRPLPPNTGKVVLSKKTSTSAGFVRIAVGRIELSANRRVDDKMRIFDASGNSIHVTQFASGGNAPGQVGERMDHFQIW